MTFYFEKHQHQANKCHMNFFDPLDQWCPTGARGVDSKVRTIGRMIYTITNFSDRFECRIFTDVK